MVRVSLYFYHADAYLGRGPLNAVFWVLLAPLLAWSRCGSARAHVLLLAAGRDAAILRHGVIAGAASTDHRGQGGAIVDAIGLGVVRSVRVVLSRRHEDRVLGLRPLKQVSNHHGGHSLLELLVCAFLHLHLRVAVALHSMNGLVRQVLLRDERTTDATVAVAGLRSHFGESLPFLAHADFLLAALLEGRRELDFDLSGGDTCQFARIRFGCPALLAEQATHRVVLLTISER